MSATGPSFEKTTESSSNYDKLEQMSVAELLNNINREDQTVAMAVQRAMPQIERLTTKVSEQLKAGGRLFYIGAGTSGRLGIVDASECPPTFGVPHELVIGLMAGGDSAIRKAVEFAEDDKQQGWKDLQYCDRTGKRRIRAVHKDRLPRQCHSDSSTSFVDGPVPVGPRWQL